MDVLTERVVDWLPLLVTCNGDIAMYRVPQLGIFPNVSATTRSHFGLMMVRCTRL